MGVSVNINVKRKSLGDVPASDTVLASSVGSVGNKQFCSGDRSDKVNENGFEGSPRVHN